MSTTDAGGQRPRSAPIAALSTGDTALPVCRYRLALNILNLEVYVRNACWSPTRHCSCSSFIAACTDTVRRSRQPLLMPSTVHSATAGGQYAPRTGGCHTGRRGRVS